MPTGQGSAMSHTGLDKLKTLLPLLATGAQGSPGQCLWEEQIARLLVSRVGLTHRGLSGPEEH